MTYQRLTLPVASLFVVAILGAFAGCRSHTYAVQIDAITKTKGATGESYRLKIKGTSEEDSLRQQEAMAIFKTALAGRAMYEAPENGKADVVLELEFGVNGDPAVKTENVQVPVFAQRGGGMTYETIEVKDAQGNITQRTQPVVEPPHAEIVGYQERMTSIPIYEKYLKISARENVPTSEGHTPAEVWSVNVSVDSEGKDMRQYLPILAAAAMDAIADDTGKLKTVNVKSNSSDVGFVKKGL